MGSKCLHRTSKVLAMASTALPIIHHGRYAIRQKLGKGSFGEVWLADDVLQGDQVAIKLLAEHVRVDEALLETQILTRLRRNDRIVTIRNVELGAPLPFIAMDYLPAGSVGDRVAAGTVTSVQAVRWTRDALDGLAYAHDEGVLHRDVKPDNLLLDGVERAVLSDFGIAEDTVRGLLAAPGVYVPHAAPEVWTSGTSKATDIFAMGCSLYRLLTGQPPFSSRNAAAAGKFVDPHRTNPQIPMAVSRVVQRALAADPADRYDDARAMLGALMACHVRHYWQRADEPDDLETWWATGDDGDYVLRLSERARRGDYVVAVTRDKGSGPRHVFKEHFPRRSAAERVRRNLLVAVVETGTV